MRGDNTDKKGIHYSKLLFYFLFMAILIQGCRPAKTASRSMLDIGQEGIIDCGIGTCAVAMTEEAWHNHKKALQAKDHYGTTTLIVAGKLVTVEKGVRVMVINHDSDEALTKVRLMEGRNYGKSGWVPYEHLTH